MVSASNPKWSSEDHATIDLLLTHPVFGKIWFTANPNDLEAYGRDLFFRSVAGEFGPIATYNAPPAPVPATISRRQCAAEMLRRGMITGGEAIAMTATATPPKMVETVFAAMPEPAQTMARIDFAAAAYERPNSLLVSLMEGTGATMADIDEFFRSAASI